MCPRSERNANKLSVFQREEGILLGKACVHVFVVSPRRTTDGHARKRRIPSVRTSEIYSCLPESLGVSTTSDKLKINRCAFDALVRSTICDVLPYTREGGNMSLSTMRYLMLLYTWRLRWLRITAHGQTPLDLHYHVGDLIG